MADIQDLRMSAQGHTRRVSHTLPYQLEPLHQTQAAYQLQSQASRQPGVLTTPTAATNNEMAPLRHGTISIAQPGITNSSESDTAVADVRPAGGISELSMWWDHRVLPRIPDAPLAPMENYNGSDIPANRNHTIPISASCSLWVTGLPPACSVKDLLSSIRSAGKIFALHITPPDALHRTTAAKLIFWDRDGLDNFLNQYVWGMFCVGGYQPQVRMHRIRVNSQPESTCSRVLRVVGPDTIVNLDYLREYFEDHFYYQLEDACLIHHDAVTRTARVEFRFSSYRAQAAAAAKWIDQTVTRSQRSPAGMADNEAEHWKSVRYFWGPDPCASH